MVSPFLLASRVRSALVVPFLATVAMGQPAVWFVDDDAAPAGDGLSWATALTSLDDAFELAQHGDQVWVAAGRYTPSRRAIPDDPRSARFDLPDLVEVYGGFRGTESSLDERVGLFGLTVLSGDLGVEDDPGDNAYRVVRFASDANYHASARLDGFLITGGHGEAGHRGGGVTVTATFGPNSWGILFLDNCSIVGNSSESGGGLAVDNLSRVKLRRCTLADNQATLRGGGAFSLSGWLWSCNSTWARNTAAEDGGALYMHSNGGDWMKFTNDVFYDNSARRGGVALVRAQPFIQGRGKFLNCTVAFNSASLGGAFAVESPAKLKVRNSIVWGNQAPIGPQIWTASPAVEVSFSDVEGGFGGAGNMAIDPMFRDAPGRDLHTLAGSPTHDAANNRLLSKDHLDLDDDGLTSEPVPFDHDERRRLTDDPSSPGRGFGNPAADLGAYEWWSPH